MAKFIRNAQVKTMTVAGILKMKGAEFFERAKNALTNREGQGALDTAVTVLISIVLGALILGGLYLIINSTILPTITSKIKEMFNYGG
jgi:hypothetical protein